MINNRLIIQNQIILPTVYLISIERYIYIGETNRSFISRLSEHLSKNGTFYKKLKNADIEVFYDNTLKIKYLSTELNEINFAKKFGVKTILRMLEADLHRELRRRRNEILCEFDIISDITRTDPHFSPMLYKMTKSSDYVSLLNKIIEETIVFINTQLRI